MIAEVDQMVVEAGNEEKVDIKIVNEKFDEPIDFFSRNWIIRRLVRI